MKIYKVIASCLVDDGLCTWLIKAKNERAAWCRGYNIAEKSPVADGGTVDVFRVTPDELTKLLAKGVKFA